MKGSCKVQLCQKLKTKRRGSTTSAEEHTERLPTKSHGREEENEKEEEEELVHKAKCCQSASVVFGGETQGQNHKEMRTD